MLLQISAFNSGRLLRVALAPLARGCSLPLDLLLGLDLLVILDEILHIALHEVLLQRAASRRLRQCARVAVREIPRSRPRTLLLADIGQGFAAAVLSEAIVATGAAGLGSKLTDLARELIDHLVCEADLVVERELLV